MKKGQKMTSESREKLRETKRLRIERERIGAKAVRLLLANKVSEAKRLAKDNHELFFIR